MSYIRTIYFSEWLKCVPTWINCLLVSTYTLYLHWIINMYLYIIYFHAGQRDCSVGWFVSLLVRLCEREVLLAGSDELCSCEGLGSPASPAITHKRANKKNKRIIVLIVGMPNKHVISCGVSPSAFGTTHGAAAWTLFDLNLITALVDSHPIQSNPIRRERSLCGLRCRRGLAAGRGAREMAWRLTRAN